MDSRVIRKSGKRPSQSPKGSSGKTVRSQAKVVINAFLVPIVSVVATGLATFAWNRIVQPAGYYSYSYSEQKIEKKKILSSKVLHTFVKIDPSSDDVELIDQKELYVHEFEILPLAHTHLKEETVKFAIPRGATLYDYKITSTRKGEDSETEVAPKEETKDGQIFVKAQLVPGHIERLTAKFLLNQTNRPTPLFGDTEAKEQPTNPFPWDFAVPIVLILVFAIVSWNYQARPHLSLGDYERIALIIFLVILITPLLGGLFRSLLALPLGTYTFAPTGSTQLADLAFPMWMGTAGTFLGGFLVVLAAEIVFPHGDNPTLARMQWWTTTGLFWGLVGAFLVSIAYNFESLKEIGWHSNGVRYGLVVTGILWGLGISLGGYFGQGVGSRFGQPLIGRACGAILGSLIFVPISTLLTLVIFTYQSDLVRDNLIKRSWGEALSQWLSLVFILVTYYLAKARLESSRKGR